MQPNEILDKIIDRTKNDLKIDIDNKIAKRIVESILFEVLSILPTFQYYRDTVVLIFNDSDGNKNMAAVIEYHASIRRNSIYITFDPDSIKNNNNRYYEIEDKGIIRIISLRAYFYNVKFNKKETLVRFIRIFASVLKEYADSNLITTINVEDLITDLGISKKELPYLFNK